MIARYKSEQVAASEAVMQNLLKNLSLERVDDRESAEVVQLKINVYYEYFYKRLTSVKEWPFDWKIILEILSSLAAPILIAVIETILH